MNNLFDRLENEIKSRGYSIKTQKAYLYHIKEFFRFNNLENTTNESIQRYFVSLTDKLDARTINLRIASVKFLFTEVLKKDVDINYMKRPKRLPEVLTKEEVTRMLLLTSNTKHKLIMQLLYGCGLRLSEVRNIKKEDVRLDENILVVRQGKGRKDRIVSLPISIARLMQTFLTEDDFPYIFRSERGGRLNKATIQKIVKNVSKKAGIRKHVHTHTLRHSYATHLLEQGTDIRIIQRLLGHSSVKTTEIYTHVSTGLIKKVISPLDTINTENSIKTPCMECSDTNIP